MTPVQSAAGFPWTTLIAAVDPAVAALGGVAIKGWQDSKSEAPGPTRARTDAQEQRQRDAYASLVVAARAWLRNQRQCKDMCTMPGMLDTSEADDVFNRADEVNEEFNRATAVVQIVGFPGARAAATRMLDAAKATSDVFEAFMASGQKSLQTGGSPPVFYAAVADANMEKLKAELDAFITNVRGDLAGQQNNRARILSARERARDHGAALRSPGRVLIDALAVVPVDAGRMAATSSAVAPWKCRYASHGTAVAMTTASPASTSATAVGVPMSRSYGPHHRREWGPGRVLVSFTRCHCPAVRAAYGETGGLGHLTVLCRVPGCRSVWYRPGHELSPAQNSDDEQGNQ